MLTCWAGGPKATALSLRGSEEIREAAIRSVSAAFGVTRAKVARGIAGWWAHDWQRDPFSRGAYSYAAVEGDESAKRLARPIAGTLFLAGEAYDEEGANGTVHGAIASGRAAARKARRSLARQARR